MGREKRGNRSGGRQEKAIRDEYDENTFCICKNVTVKPLGMIEDVLVKTLRENQANSRCQPHLVLYPLSITTRAFFSLLPELQVCMLPLNSTSNIFPKLFSISWYLSSLSFHSSFNIIKNLPYTICFAGVTISYALTFPVLVSGDHPGSEGPTRRKRKAALGALKQEHLIQAVQGRE